MKFWINILASWFRPFSGFINSVVFVLKESQYPSSIEGQQQQTEFPMGFVDQNQPSSQARLRIDTTSDFVYEPKSTPPLDETRNEVAEVTDSRTRWGSQKWAKKLENYSLDLDEEQTIGAATILRYVPSEDAFISTRKSRKQQLFPKKAKRRTKPDIEPTDSKADYYDLMNFLRAAK